MRGSCRYAWLQQKVQMEWMLSSVLIGSPYFSTSKYLPGCCCVEASLLIRCCTDACSSRTRTVDSCPLPPGLMADTDAVACSSHWNVSRNRCRRTRVEKPPVRTRTSTTPDCVCPCVRKKKKKGSMLEKRFSSCYLCGFELTAALFSPTKACNANPTKLAAAYL